MMRRPHRSLVAVSKRTPGLGFLGAVSSLSTTCRNPILLTEPRPLQYHASDLIDNVYAPGDMTDYLVHFVNHGDPNGAGNNLINWPQYDTTTRQQMTFVDDDAAPLVFMNDTYRVDGFNKLTELSLQFPL